MSEPNINPPQREWVRVVVIGFILAMLSFMAVMEVYSGWTANDKLYQVVNPIFMLFVGFFNTVLYFLGIREGKTSA